jgi:hypothetical protein
MGFIARDGDIIVDAVLTDIGRQKLARNDGSFKIVAYSFCDDEIDYSLFNPSTGSSFVDEQILNLPIFEANVNERLNGNYPLLTITNPNLKYLPVLVSDTSTITIGEQSGQSAGVTVRFYQSTNQNARIVPVEIQDSGFTIEIPSNLLYIENQSPTDTTPYGTALYVIQRDAALIQASQGSQITFKIRPQSLTNTVWNTLGNGTAPNRTISTKIKAKGINSGLNNVIDVIISEEFTR